MNLYLILLLLLLVSSIRPGKRDGGSLSRERMLNIRGFFSLMIILFHYAGMQFFDTYLPENIAFCDFWQFINQCVVAMFLFYSGFGLTVSFSERGPSYQKRLLKYRIPNLYMTYVIAALMMVYFCWIMAIRWYTNGELVKVFTAWEGYFGNDQWYIFVQLALYLLAVPCMLPLRLKGDSRRLFVICCLLLTAASLLLMFTLIRLGKLYFWYDTIPAFILGIWWAVGRDQLEKWLKNPLLYWPLLVIGIAVLFQLPLYDYPLRSALFCLCVQLINEKLTFTSPVLRYLGQHSLSIYLLMRMPMHLMNETGVIAAHPYLALVPIILLTLAFSAGFDRFCGLLWERITELSSRREKN